MATFIMLPNGTVGTSAWTADSGLPAIATTVDNDNGDTEYAYSSSDGERMTFDLASPSVVEADVESINTVTVKASASKTAIGPAYVKFYMMGTDADSGTITTGPDTVTISGTSYTTYSGPNETSPNSGDWVYGDLAGLQIRVQQFRNPRFGQNRISYLYAEVDYTEAVAADNATFFGANF